MSYTASPPFHIVNMNQSTTEKTLAHPLKLPTLHSSESAGWFRIFKLFFITEGLWEIVSGAESEPTRIFDMHKSNQQAIEMKRAEWKEWKKQDAKAILYMYNHAGVFAKKIADTLDLTNSHTLWKDLREMSWANSHDDSPAMSQVRQDFIATHSPTG